MPEAEKRGRVVYMCLKDGGPLCAGDAPMVFDDIEDAEEALYDARDEEAIVAEIKLETVVHRLREAGIEHVHYQPAGSGFATKRTLEELARS